MKDSCKVLESDIEFKNLNNHKRKYDIVEVNGTKVTRCLKEKTWAERYRPRKIFDLIISDVTRKYLEESVKTGKMPHTLLYSQNGGLGKTSISQVITHEMNCDFLTVSANVERGIQAVKDKIQPFSSKVSMYGGRKLVCIEEIGDATGPQVDSIKSIIDKYSSNMSVIITTNTMGNISQPLRTRFKIIDFNKFSKEDELHIMKLTLLRIMAILDIENIEYDKSDIKYLYDKYKFSFREIIMTLESSVIDGKLVLDKVQVSSSSIDSVLEKVNEEDYKGIASISEGVNVIEFLETINSSYLDILVNIEHLTTLNMIMVDLQDRLVRNPAFPSICFTKACFDLIKYKVKFKTV